MEVPFYDIHLQGKIHMGVTTTLNNNNIYH